ncbi:hypothetical protein EBE87_25515 [Pseudoroseomonas wenyumeiae]|uniref:Aspartate aminotransferase family protein n=1 Tax=Teichococcus wenyumeiae TaxID=2478470 RepID=A0A3A9JVF1_9PROT|nr:hypothetical protein D6Z83_16915 [Pseudoroseomonas wenyumeiae]RMI15511.1 hypothetical protein EBE87_25515 [Pseudoroseomonas wenyumeiae]
MSGSNAVLHSNSFDHALRARTEYVIPAGLWDHLSAWILPEGYPQFFVRAEGCHLADADGRRFIDMICS